MSNSTHKVEVVPLVLSKHPDADRLSICSVDDYTCVTNTEQWNGSDKAAWIPPDNIVDTTRPEFAFLAAKAKDNKYRIKAMKLRGILSFGLLVPAPEGSQIGDDVTDLIGVVHYDPVVHHRSNRTCGYFSGAEVADEPAVPSIKYDLEAGRKYSRLLDGDVVTITEKCHGSSCRYVFHDGKMHCGSRNEWKREYPDTSNANREFLLSRGCPEDRIDEVISKQVGMENRKNLWWNCLDATPELRRFCENNPNCVVYGEVIGQQDIKYGLSNGNVKFVAFDISINGRFVDYDEFKGMCSRYSIPTVPIIEEFVPFDNERVKNLAEGRSLYPGANHVREGVVVKPVVERRDDRIGRVALKWVGAGYLERSQDVEILDDERPDIRVGKCHVDNLSPEEMATAKRILG